MMMKRCALWKGPKSYVFCSSYVKTDCIYPHYGYPSHAPFVLARCARGTDPQTSCCPPTARLQTLVSVEWRIT
jgi:hypothetical protein